MKNVTHYLIGLSLILFVVVVIGAVKVRSLSDDIVRLSYSVLEKDSDVAEIKNYLTKNIVLQNTYPDELTDALNKLGIDTKHMGYAALFPRNGCGSCMNMLCYTLEDFGIDKNDVHIVMESENVTMRSELRGSGYPNCHLDGALFSNIPSRENVTLVAFENGGTIPIVEK